MLVSLRSWELWLYGLIGGVVGGVASALNAVFSVPAAHAMGIKVAPLDWQQIKVISIGTAVSTAAAYLMKSPLPQLPQSAPKDDSTPKA